jgi:transposase
MGICEGRGLPIALHLAPASPGETTLVEPTLDARFCAAYPTTLMGDKAYDSDPLDDALLHRWGITLIARHRANRRRPASQDGRSLRRLARRWKIERLFAWLYNFRRLVVRWDYKPENYLAFLHLGAVQILLRHI